MRRPWIERLLNYFWAAYQIGVGRHNICCEADI